MDIRCVRIKTRYIRCFFEIFINFSNGDQCEDRTTYAHHCWFKEYYLLRSNPTSKLVVRCVWIFSSAQSLTRNNSNITMKWISNIIINSLFICMFMAWWNWRSESDCDTNCVWVATSNVFTVHTSFGSTHQI